jgi:hypothetical protein
MTEQDEPVCVLRKHLHQDKTMPLAATTPEPPSLDIPEDKLAFIIEKAREFDVKEEDSDADSGSNPIDDGDTDVLESGSGDSTHEELAGAIRELNEDERSQLIALAWLGRGTYDLDEWQEAVSTAKSEHGRRAAEYLIGLPLLGDYLEEGLALFDEGIVDDSDTREGLNEENEPLGNMPDRTPDTKRV